MFKKIALGQLRYPPRNRHEVPNNMIHKLRLKMGLSRIQFAKMFKLNRTTIFYYEKNKAMPRIATARKILALCKEHEISASLEDIIQDKTKIKPKVKKKND